MKLKDMLILSGVYLVGVLSGIAFMAGSFCQVWP